MFFIKCFNLMLDLELPQRFMFAYESYRIGTKENEMMSEYEILRKIKSPEDVKKLNTQELSDLCAEMRSAIIHRVSKIGGHLGPNLGIVEVATALHYVFDSPKDKIVWDVSHQCYPHKMLTGRAQAYMDEAHFEEVSGFTSPAESEHDIFTIGHTSTSVSLAAGLAKARDMQDGKENVIAVIGDGSLSGGQALEGLDNAAELKSNFIVVVNDNEMSIAENHGGLYGNLAVLRATKGKALNNIFSALGFDYYYVDNGNNVADLIDILKQIKDTDRPTLLHIHTLKGKGYKLAEENKEAFHWLMPFEVETGDSKCVVNGETYGRIMADYLLKRAAIDDKLAVITAATPGALCLNEFRKQYPQKYFDVGIAEEHAIAFTAGMAKAKMNPVALFFGGFIQRAYDQISQDLCIDNHPGVLVVENTGISGGDVTHLGMFDIAMLANIPNLVYLAPTSRYEALKMMDWALAQKEHPVAVRLPSGAPAELKYQSTTEIELNKSELVHQGNKVAILGLGSFMALAQETAELLKTKGIEATIINPRFITALDEKMLNDLLINHEIIVTLEDGILSGGYGEKIAAFYGDKPVKVYTFGAKKEFTDKVDLAELYQRYNLTPELIVAKIL